ncbi:MAG: alpha/beta fold hydrolase [Actinomycetota bacterium]
MGAVVANGQRIEYAEAGVGEPLLLISGMTLQLTDWPDAFVNGLVGSGYRVVRFDNREVGLSSASEGPPPGLRTLAAAAVAPNRVRAPYELADMADDAVALLDALGIESAHIVGLSMGGMIAQILAIAHPTRVLSLTSIMSNTSDRRNGLPNPSLPARLAWLNRRPLEGNAAVEALLASQRMIGGPAWLEGQYRERAEIAVDRSYRPDAVFHQMLASLVTPKRTRALATVTVPTLVVHGIADPLVRPSGGHATARAIPGSRLLMFPDMGHDLPAHRIDEIVDAIGANAAKATLQ